MGTFGSGLWGGAGSAAAAPNGTPASELFYDALRLANVTKYPDAGALAPSPDQLADCRRHANLMLDQARIRRPLIYSVVISTYVLGASKTYTLGPGGTLVSTAGLSQRPAWIERARLILSSTGTPIHLMVFRGTFAEFADLAVQDIPGAQPRFLYCDNAAPLATIYLVPQDLGGDQLELYTPVQIPSIATPGDLLQLATGYQDWFVNNLAVRLASVFASQGAFVSDDTRQEARRSTQALQALNTKSPRLKSDAPRSGRNSGSSFNYFSGMDK